MSVLPEQWAEFTASFFGQVAEQFPELEKVSARKYTYAVPSLDVILDWELIAFGTGSLALFFDNPRANGEYTTIAWAEREGQLVQTERSVQSQTAISTSTMELASLEEAARTIENALKAKIVRISVARAQGASIAASLNVACASCGKSSPQHRCAGCKSALYCNDKCHEADWARHHVACSK